MRYLGLAVTFVLAASGVKGHPSGDVGYKL
jgi:hypothetical protein